MLSKVIYPTFNISSNDVTLQMNLKNVTSIKVVQLLYKTTAEIPYFISLSLSGSGLDMNDNMHISPTGTRKYFRSWALPRSSNTHYMYESSTGPPEFAISSFPGINSVDIDTLRIQIYFDDIMLPGVNINDTNRIGLQLEIRES